MSTPQASTLTKQVIPAQGATPEEPRLRHADQGPGTRHRPTDFQSCSSACIYTSHTRLLNLSVPQLPQLQAEITKPARMAVQDVCKDSA